MQFFHQQALVFLEVPKTGSSAVAQALRPFSAMEFHRPPHARHMNAGAFNAHTRGYLKRVTGKEVETFAVMREPVDRLVSWFRYLQSPAKAGDPDNTVGWDFADFVAAALEDSPRFPGIGRQDNFLMGEGERPLVTHIFQYDRPEHLSTFLRVRFRQEIAIDRVNVSTPVPVEVTDSLRAAVTEARPREARLWQDVSTEGYLHTPGA